jgi:O-antigen ligase
MNTFLIHRFEHSSLRLAIVIGVLGLSFWLAKSPTSPISNLVFLAIPGLIAVISLLKYPGFGLSLLIIASLVIPIRVGTGTQTFLNAAILMVNFLFTLWILDRLVLKRDFHLVRSRPLAPLLGLCMAAVLSYIIGQLDWFAFAPHAPIRSQIGGMSLFFFSAMAFLLGAYQVNSSKYLEKLVWLFLTLACGVIIGELVPDLGIIRLYNTGATGSLFWIWVISLSLSQALVNNNLRLRWRVLLFLISLAAILDKSYISKDWLSGWLPSLIAVFTILLVWRPRLGLPIGAIAAIVGIRRFQSFLTSLKITVFIRGDEYSYLTRTEAWQVIREIIRTNPITGFGPANYYFYTPLFPLRGFYLQFNSHNQYVDLIAQTGFIGLAFFLWFTWEIGRLGWRLKDRVPKGFCQAYVIGALGGLAGMLAAGMLVDWIIPFVYNIGFNGFQASILGWLFLGGLVALERYNLLQSPIPSE